MGTLDPLRLTAREAKRLLVDGEVSAAELATVYLDQIAAVEDRVHAFILVTAENAARYAAKVDKEMQATRGALAGLPLAVKDNMVTEGVVTTCASRILAGYQPIYTATAVRKLWDDHVVMLGKTNMDEFAMGSSTENSAFGPSHNPWDLNACPGRLQRRLGGRRRGRRGPLGPGLRHRRLHPPAGRPLRRRRHEAHLRRRLPLRPRRLRLLARPDRSAHARGARLRAAAQAHRRQGRQRLDQRGAALRGRAAHRRAAGRIALRRARRVPERRRGARRAGAVRGDARARGGAGRAGHGGEPAAHRDALPAYYVIAPAEASSTSRASTACATGYRAAEADDLIDMYDAHPRRRLRRRGQAAHHARHLRALLRLLRRLLRPRAERAHHDRRGLRRRLRARST